MENFASMTLNQTFCSDADPPNMLDFHIPAVAAWIRILGKEIRHWSVVSTNEKYFSRASWDRWRDGFEGFSKSEDLNMEIKLIAERAWRTMCDLERTELK